MPMPAHSNVHQSPDAGLRVDLSSAKRARPRPARPGPGFGRPSLSEDRRPRHFDDDTLQAPLFNYGYAKGRQGTTWHITPSFRNQTRRSIGEYFHKWKSSCLCRPRGKFLITADPLD
jgi:hypothetical protein